MPQLTIWDSFSKRSNSTKRPSGTGTTVNCALKEGTSLASPVFELSGVESAVNYALFEGRYYFVTDIVQNSNHMYELHCVFDGMGTWKEYISNYNTFVERSASDYDPLINDKLLTTQTDIVHTGLAFVSGSGINISTNGAYLIRTTSGSGIIGYAVSYSVYQELLDFLFDEQNTEYLSLDLQNNSWIKTFFNPFQYILDVQWFPFYPSDFNRSQTPTNSIKFGWWNFTPSSGSVFICDEKPFVGNYNLKSGVSTYYGDWRDYDPEYTPYTVYLPGYGTVNLSSILMSNDVLEAWCYIDPITGNVRWTIEGTDVSGGNATTYAEFNGQYSVPIQIGQIATNVNGFYNGALDMTTNFSKVFTLADPLNGIKNGITATMDVAKSIAQPLSSVNGNQGNMSTLKYNPTVKVGYYNYGCADFPLANSGRPLFRYRRLGDLSGFVKCGMASIEIPSFESERNEVNNWLNRGFYME